MRGWVLMEEYESIFLHHQRLWHRSVQVRGEMMVLVDRRMFVALEQYFISSEWLTCFSIRAENYPVSLNRSLHHTIYFGKLDPFSECIFCFSWSKLSHSVVARTLGWSVHCSESTCSLCVWQLNILLCSLTVERWTESHLLYTFSSKSSCFSII